MRTTLELPDRVVSEAKVRAITESTTLTALIVEGLTARLKRSAPTTTLPVSRAADGIRDGVDWTRLEEAAEPAGSWHR